jgi:hypothetical protein
VEPVDAGTQAPDPHLASVRQVMSAMRSDLRKCYNSALTRDPEIAGSTTITAQIDATGAVVMATASDGSSLPADVLRCITSRVQKATFDAPGDAGATLKIPVTFKRYGAP